MGGAGASLDKNGRCDIWTLEGVVGQFGHKTKSFLELEKVI